jgi:hypothetical protein
MLNSGYQEGSFSAQISQYRTQAAHLEAENIRLKNLLLEMHTKNIELENKLKEKEQPVISKDTDIKDNTPTEILNVPEPTNTAVEPKKNKYKKNETK